MNQNNEDCKILSDGGFAIRVPKRVAEIKLCGIMTFYVNDTMSWQRPTDEQIKNLKDLFCIEVIPYEDATDEIV